MKRAFIVLVAPLALVGVACSSEQAPSPSAASDPVPSVAETAAAAAASPTFALPESAAELAALLPQEIRGEQGGLRRAYSGEQLLSGEMDVTVNPGFTAFLARIGAEPDSISFAFAFSLRSQEDAAGVVAFRIAGQAEEDLNREFQSVMDSDAVQVEWREANVGGKDVLSADDPDNPGNSMHLYTTRDLIFLVTAMDDAVAEQMLEGLP